MDDVSGKVAVVTGGASGIGRGIVHALLDDGATVVIADVESAALQATVAELAERGDVSGVHTDVSDPASVEALADAVYERHGACHLRSTTPASRRAAADCRGSRRPTTGAGTGSRSGVRPAHDRGR